MYILTLGQVVTTNSYLKPCKAAEVKLEGRKMRSKIWIP